MGRRRREQSVHSLVCRHSFPAGSRQAAAALLVAAALLPATAKQHLIRDLALALVLQQGRGTQSRACDQRASREEPRAGVGSSRQPGRERIISGKQQRQSKS